jgi:tetratricopeptide (TPR) repeat protein
LYHWDEAITDLQAVVKAKPEFWQAHYQLGIELAANGNEPEAQKEFEASIRYRPDFAPAHLYLGITLAAQKKPTRALVEFRTVLQLDPSNASARQEIESIQPLTKSSEDSESSLPLARHSDR